MLRRAGLLRCQYSTVVNKVPPTPAVSVKPDIAPRDVDDDRSSFSWKLPQFSDHRVIYSSKTNAELMRAYLVFTACSYDFMIDNHAKFLKWSKSLLGQRIFSKLVQKTIFSQFMVLPRDEVISKLVGRHVSAGLTPMFAYTAGEFHGAAATSSGSSADHGRRRKWFSTNIEAIKHSIDIAASCSGLSKFTPIVATKLSFMEESHLLHSLSNVIVQQTSVIKSMLCSDSSTNKPLRQFVNDVISKCENKSGNSLADEFQFVSLAQDDTCRQNSLDQNLVSSLCTNVKFHVVLNSSLQSAPFDQNQQGIIQRLSMEEIEALLKLWNQINDINQQASERDVVVNYDAEQSYMQPAIETFVVDSMRRFNRQQPTVLNTYQCYLKRTHGVVADHLSLADKEGFCFGAKVVRGAYMEEERKRAQDNKCSSPVNDTYEATTRMYDDVMRSVLDYTSQRRAGTVRAIFATHNEDTVLATIQQLITKKINPVEHNIVFAQLLGTRDFISYSLGAAQYPCAKLIHYANPEDGVAYLSRRLQENRSGLPSPLKERRLLMSELKSRYLRRK